MVFEYNLLCQIILVWMCTRDTLKVGDFMPLPGGGTSKCVILQGGGTCGFTGVSIKCAIPKHFCAHVNLEYSQTG